MKKLIKIFKEFKEKKNMNAEVAATEAVMEILNRISDSSAKYKSKLLIQEWEREIEREELKDMLLTKEIECIVDKKIEDLHDTFMAELAKHNIEKHGEEVLNYDKLFDKEGNNDEIEGV